MRHLYLTAVAVLVTLTAGCSEGDLLTAPTPSARVDGTWSLVQVTSGSLSLTEAKAASRFVLTLAGDRALLKADCNTCAGDFRLDNDVISLSLQACTPRVLPEFAARYAGHAGRGRLAHRAPRRQPPSVQLVARRYSLRTLGSRRHVRPTGSTRCAVGLA